jgi:hypothetical protein
VESIYKKKKNAMLPTFGNSTHELKRAIFEKSNAVAKDTVSSTDMCTKSTNGKNANENVHARIELSPTPQPLISMMIIAIKAEVPILLLLKKVNPPHCKPSTSTDQPPRMEHAMRLTHLFTTIAVDDDGRQSTTLLGASEVPLVTYP